MRVRFRDFVLDTERRELARRGEVVHLPPKAFQLLQLLVERRPKAVAQDELYDLIWPGTFVEKKAVHNLVYQLRNTLGDRNHAVIRTAYGFGFSFAAAASDDAPRAARWQLVIGDTTFDLREGDNIVGRERDATIAIESPSVSRHHARMTVSDEGVVIEDLGSKNGTYVSGRRIRVCRNISEDDRLVFGTIAATLQRIKPARTTETVC